MLFRSAEEIDLARAQAALKRSQEQLVLAQSEQRTDLSEIWDAIARARNRIRIYESTR